MSRGSLLQPHELGSMKRMAAEAAIRERTQCAYLGEHVALGRVLGRYKFFVDTRDQGFGSHVLLDGYWEIWLTLFCLRNLRAGMVAIDVGANFGYYSLLFAELVGIRGHLVAVEPNPHAADLLQRSINLNGFSDRSSVRQMALGSSKDARLRLFVPATEPKNALVIGETDCLDHLMGQSIEVPSSTLDHVCSTFDSVDFIKIDAEGYEQQIFAGMAQTIARCQPIIVMEINVARYADSSAFIDALFAVYGMLYAIDFEGFATSVSKHELMSTRLGEDWLVVLSPKPPL